MIIEIRVKVKVACGFDQDACEKLVAWQQCAERNLIDTGDLVVLLSTNDLTIGLLHNNHRIRDDQGAKKRIK